VQDHARRIDPARVFRPAIDEDIGQQPAHRDHQERVAVEPVAQARPPIRLLPLAQRHGEDLGRVAFLEIAQMGVVFVVVELHDPVGREREDAEPVARQVIGAFRGIERAVPAIMLQHVEAHTRKGVDHDQRHHQPPDGPGLHRQPEREEIEGEGAEIAQRRDAVVALRSSRA
jgi:hypothetical protein